MYAFICDDLTDTASTYAYGLFIDDKLIAQCSIGGAEEIDVAGSDDELLSDVYVLPEYRQRHYALTLLKYVMETPEHNKHNIWCMPVNETAEFYHKIGFVYANQTLMLHSAVI